MIVIAILVHLGQNFLKQYIDQKGGEAQLKRALCWMFLRSCLSVVIRLLCCWVLLSLLIAGPVAWRLYRYNSVLGGTELRFCQCTQFLHSQDHCDVHFGEVDFTSEGFQQRWAVYANLTQMGLVSNISDCHPSWTNAQGPAAQTLMDQAEAWLLDRPLQQTFLPVFLLLVLLTLFAAGLLLPIVPEFFVLIFNIFVPVLLLAFTFFLVQFRVLGAITQERYFGYELNREVWSYMLQVTLLGAMIGLGFSRFIRTFMHRYYSRSLHRAFYAKGENCTWADVRRNIYCPMLLINATVNDYMQLGDSKPFSYMTFTQLFSGGSRLGYYSAYGQRPLARTAALSGGAIDGFILGDSDSMSLRFWLEASGFFMGDFVSISRSPGEWVRVQRYLALLVLEVVYILLFIASWLTSAHGKGNSSNNCEMQLRLVRVAAWWWLSIGILSFFSFFDCLGWLQHSPVIRTMQQATMFYYQSPRPPRSVYLSDGGVLENTGILALLQRGQRRIVAVYCGEEAKGQEMGCLHKLLQTMHDEDIGYLYDLKDPRRGPLYAIRECAWYNGYLLELGIFYYDHPEQDDNILTVLRNKIPPGRPSSIWKHLSEEEVLNLQPAELDETFKDMEQSDLGGCCCDCCHKTWCNRCMGRFPSPPTANQFLTPQMFNALCRLGYDLPAEVSKFFHTPLVAPLLKSKKSPRLDLDYISSSNVLILGGGGGFAALAGALQVAGGVILHARDSGRFQCDHDFTKLIRKVMGYKLQRQQHLLPKNALFLRKVEKSVADYQVWLDRHRALANMPFTTPLNMTFKDGEGWMVAGEEADWKRRRLEMTSLPEEPGDSGKLEEEDLENFSFEAMVAANDVRFD
eukprot:symbB.v1.2.007898.t2/scaffold491.1/size196728/2